MCSCPAHRALVDCECQCDHTNDRLAQWRARAEQAEATIESVRQYAAELRTTTSPAGIAAVYADRLEELLPARAVKATEGHGDGRTPTEERA